MDSLVLIENDNTVKSAKLFTLDLFKISGVKTNEKEKITRMWPSGARPALATLQQLIVCRDWSRSVVHPFSEMLIQSSKFKNVVPIKVFL